jgi:DNA-binding NtrC family response regulator
MIRILLHSQDTKLAALLTSALRSDCAIQLETEFEQILTRAEEADVVLVDFDSNESSLEDQLTIFDRLTVASAPIIVMTDDLRRSTATEFLIHGAFDCVRKPPSILELRVVIRRAYEHYEMKTELEARRKAPAIADQCDQLIGSSLRAQALYEMIRRVADLNAFVLVTGESGTGKELVARAIHNLGLRSNEPFVAVSCGAIPETLIESELFGAEKGAFTGSNATRIGYLEQAGEGTLFLDEIGELSLNTQVKLLRVLQQREFSRLGSNKLLPLRARVLFATHRNLAQMAEEGTFRRDLFFRVNVVTIPVPPLRERWDDLVTLSGHFLQRYAEEYGKPVREIRPNAMELLQEYDWPGNIRELENVIQRAVILSDGNSIQRADLPEHLWRRGGEETDAPEPEQGCFEDMLRHFKVSLAMRTIDECNGNKSMAAKKLRVSRAYLHRLIRTSGGRAAAAGCGA